MGLAASTLGPAPVAVSHQLPLLTEIIHTATTTLQAPRRTLPEAQVPVLTPIPLQPHTMAQSAVVPTRHGTLATR